ncbi:MAG TPA: formyltransferase family protein [Verrucomicrobiae bacterium]
MKQYATITVIGRDKTGVIARVTNFLFEQHANIEALEEQVTRGQFSMTLQASWAKKNFDSAKVRAGLKKLAGQLGMEIKVRFTEPGRRQRFAIFVTKEPRCFETIAQAVAKRSLVADPALVIGNHAGFEPRARKFRLPFVCVPWEDRAGAELRALELLDDHQVDFVVLARFMKILSPNFVWRYKNKIINIHPSLLPSFPGPQAYEHGVKIAGCTAHFVNMHLDDGPIIAQGSFHIRPGMTLPEIIATGQKLEAQVLLKAVKRYLSKRLDVYWGTVNEV